MLFHEKNFKGLNGFDLKGHLFKGGNNPVFRAIWTYNEESNHYDIGKIWFDHNEYEREAVSYLKSYDVEKANWKNITNRVYQLMKDEV